MYRQLPPFVENITALARARELSAGRLDSNLEAQIDQLLAHLKQRSQFGLDTTVVAFAGGTGAGKSSLFNLVNGVDLAQVSAIRPTTSQALAVVNHDASQLLDWLGISQRQILHDLPSRYGLPNTENADFAVLDLPDIDSTNLLNREIAENLAQRVDVLIWVIDPQKYADAVLFEDFLTEMTEHSKTTIVVLNQIDTLDEVAREQVLSDLRRLLATRKITAEVIAASAKTGQGTAQIRARIKAAANETSAARNRLSADIRSLAAKLLAFSEDTSALNDVAGNHETDNRNFAVYRNAPAKRESTAQMELELSGITAALWRALGLDELTASAAQAHLYRGHKYTSWLCTRWRFARRRDPLAKFRLPSFGFGMQTQHSKNQIRAQVNADTRESERSADSTDFAQLNQLSRVEPGSATLSVPSVLKDQQAVASVENEIQRLIANRAAAMPIKWRAQLLRLTQGSAENLLSRTGQIMDQVQLRKRTPSWWRLVNLLQWLSLFSLISGVVWLLLWNFGELIGLFLPDPPAYGVFALPLLLILGGVLCGWLLALLSEPLLRRGAKLLQRRARRQLQRQMQDIVHSEIGAKLAAEMANYAEYREIFQCLKSAR